MKKHNILYGLAVILAPIVFLSAFYLHKTKTDYLVTISSDYGIMKLVLFDDTPIHKTNFIKLAKEGKYNGTSFHRVINNFMIQGGEINHDNDPSWDTASFENKTLPNEIRDNHKHIYGALAAARTENPKKRSDISQFYIVQNHNGTHFLDNKYTVFGQLIVGFDVLDAIAQQQVNGSSPVKKCVINISVEEVKRSDIIKFYGDIYKKYNVNITQ